MKQEAVTLILWLVATYAAICAAAYFGNRSFMYFPDPTRVAPDVLREKLDSSRAAFLAKAWKAVHETACRIGWPSS
jgi:hypothetical protein